MVHVQAKLIGGKEIHDLIANQIPHRANEIMTPALRAGVNVYARALRKAAPRSVSGRKGSKKYAAAQKKRSPASIKYGPLHKKIRTKTTGRKGQNPEANVFILDAFYWRFVEFGTKRMRPHPWIRPIVKSASFAQSEVAGRIIEAARKAAEKALAKEAQKHNAGAGPK